MLRQSTSRYRCPHNFRPSRGICTRCLCETIDELLESGSEGSKIGTAAPSLSTISEIIHNLRLILTNLNSNDQKMDADLGEIEIRPIIDTFTELLKLRNDEIGLMIAQGLQKICPRIASKTRDYLMKTISHQLRKSPSLTLGSLECLRVALLNEECLTLFLEKFGQDIIPKVFQTLRSTTAAWVDGRRSSQSETSSQQVNSQNQYLVGNEFGTSTRDDKSKIVNIIYSIMERTLEVVKDGGGSLDLIDECFGSNNNTGVDIFHAFLPHFTEIFIDSVTHLKENQPAFVAGKVLGFLAKFLKHELALSMLLKSNNSGVALCSALKRMLFGYTNVIQKQTLTILINMFTTYEAALEVPGDHQRYIIDLPSLMQKVDMIHAISQVMNTSDPELFKLIFQLLERWICIPFFSGKMSAVIEAGLRIVSVVINSDSPGIGNIHSFFLRAFESMENVSASMQNQIVSLYNTLPSNWKPIQYLQWAKLLLQCTEPNFHPILMEFYQKALQSMKEDPCSVSRLKLLLVLSQAVSVCVQNAMDSDDNGEIMNADVLVIQLINIKCIPSVMALTKFGKTSDSTYVAILLQMLRAYPTELLVSPTKCSDESESPQIFTVEYENENDDDVPTIETTDKEVNLFNNELYSQNSRWTAGTYMKILTWIRSNIELLKNKMVFDQWNKNMSRVVLEMFPIYLSPLSSIWKPLSLSGSEHFEEHMGFLIHVFEHLDLDIYKWAEVIGRNVVYNFEINTELQLQQEAILVFCYFYLLFNMKDNEKLFSSAFVPSLACLLDQLLHNKQYLLESEWECLSFYFKVSFLIVSCLPECLTGNMIEMFEILVLDVEEAMSNFQSIVTFCSRGFNLLLRWNVLPMKEVTKLLERWAREDWEEFRHFFETVKFNDDDGTLKNHLVTITAFGSIETSNFMVGVVKTRQIQRTSTFDPGLLHSTLSDMSTEILNDFGQVSNRQLNFCNVLELALGDDPMFCLEQTIPSNFFCDCIKIILKFRQVESIAVTCLRFLFNFISTIDNSGFVRHVCLSSNEFIKFLGKRLSLKKGCPAVNEIAFRLMAIIVNSVDTVEHKYHLDEQKIEKFRWNMSSLIPYMPFCITNISFLELISSLLRKNFERSLIKVKEVKTKSQEFITMLLNLQFHALSLFHKDMEDNGPQVWKFLYELLCFSERGFQGKTFSSTVLMHPWNGIIISVGVLPESSPFSLPVECLRFLVKWTDYYKNLIISDPMLFSLDYQAFSIINQFFQLLEFFSAARNKSKGNPVLTALEGNMETDESSDQSSWMEFDVGEAYSPERFMKTELIDQIINSCNSFVSRFPDGLQTVGGVVETHQEKEDSVPINEHEPMSPFSSCSGSSTSTCSGSEFGFELSPRP